MKKSKVILPAMALLLFSTAASITGTVAWFSASRVFNTSAAEFGINAVDGNLAAVVEARVGTQLNSSDNTKVEAHQDQENHHLSRLTHGSVDFTAKNSSKPDPKPWIINQEPKADGTDWFVDKDYESKAYDDEYDTDGSGTEDTAGARYASNWKIKDNTETISNVSTTVHYYVAFSWKVTFSYTFADSESLVGIFMNLGESKFDVANTPIAPAAAQNETRKTATGFRVGMVPATGKAKVFGNTATPNTVNPEGDNKLTVAGAGYIKADGKADTQGTYVTTGNASTCDYLQHDSGTYSKVDEGATVATAEARPELIGKLTTSSAELSVIFTAWYEGQDPGVVSAAEMDSVTATLSFYARKLTPANP